MDKQKRPIDLLIYAVGYETRAITAATKVSAQKTVAVTMPASMLFNYQTNLAYAQKNGAYLLNSSDINSDYVQQILTEVFSSIEVIPGVPSIIALDVSSMPREIMAYIIIGIKKFSLNRSVGLRIIYTTGQYKAPSQQMQAYTDFNPIPGLEGWTLYPERPLSVILGLGYEADQAVGVVEYFDPSGKWAFIPNGKDERFKKAVMKANGSLLSLLEERNQLNYFVRTPDRLYFELRGLAEILSKRSRVVLVPAGPKIFSAISILVGLELGNEVSLWRASTHEHINPSDTLPASLIISFDYNMAKLIAPPSY